MQNKLAIIGPTSIGKTSLALKLCKKFDGQIVSVDSRQVYKYMDIGTGKKPLDSLASCEKGDGYWILDGIKIWGYDIVEPCNRFSVYDFVTYLTALPLSQKFTIFVGGTGFYFDILLGRRALSEVEPDWDFRSKLSRLSLNELNMKLKALNPSKAKIVDSKNPVRLVRAIEIETSSVNAKRTQNHKESVQNCAKEEVILKDCLVVGLTADREVLYDRVDKWVEKVYELGLPEEARNLMDKGWAVCEQLKGLNYNNAIMFLDGTLSREGAILKTKNDNHAYIRRQQTYFKRMKDVVWFDVTKEGFDKDLETLVQSKIINE